MKTELPTESFENIEADIVASGTAAEYDSSQESKPKRGRPRKETLQAPPPDFLTPEILSEMISFIFDGIAYRRGDHWKLIESETQTISSLAAKVINKHAPEWLSRFGDEVALAAVLGMTIFQRYKIDLEKLKQSLELPKESILQ